MLEENSKGQKADELVATAKTNFISDDGVGWTTRVERILRRSQARLKRKVTRKHDL